MIDDDEGEEIDLSALNAADDATQTERVVSAAMMRIRASTRQAPRFSPSEIVLTEVGRWWYPGLAAAAVILTVAGGVVALTPPRPSQPMVVAEIEGQLLEWARSGHVPTNADLLATFRGVSR